MIIKKAYSFSAIIGFSTLIVGIMFCNNAKSNPNMPVNRAMLFKRAQSLNQGIGISWLEQALVPGIIDSNGIKRKDMELLRKLGPATIRRSVAFD